MLSFTYTLQFQDTYFFSVSPCGLIYKENIFKGSFLDFSLSLGIFLNNIYGTVPGSPCQMHCQFSCSQDKLTRFVPGKVQ